MNMFTISSFMAFQYAPVPRTHAGWRVRHDADVGVDDAAALGVLVPPPGVVQLEVSGRRVFFGGASCVHRRGLRHAVLLCAQSLQPCVGGDGHETTRLFAPLCRRRRARRCAPRVQGRCGVGRASSGLGMQAARTDTGALRKRVVSLS